MSLGHRLQKGYCYLKSWPLRPELSSLFPENRVIMATRLGIKLMPAIAVITVFLPILLNRMEFISQAAFMALFFLTLPVQGLLWLSKRADTVLPLSLVTWYAEIKDKLQEKGESVPEQRPLRYQHLAQLLTKAYKRLDKGLMY